MNLRRFFCDHKWTMVLWKAEDGTALVHKQCEFCGHELFVRDPDLVASHQKEYDAEVALFMEGYKHGTEGAHPALGWEMRSYHNGWAEGVRSMRHAMILAESHIRRAA